jgi:SAM-dependent methyltransferase
MNDHDMTIDQCPLCGASSGTFRLVTQRGTHFSYERAMLCGACTLVLLTPRLSPTGLAEYYASDAFSVDFRGAARPDTAATQYRDQRAQRRWALLHECVPRTGRVLEIGCSSGNFLRVLSDHGLETVGIDPSRGYAEFARQRGLSVRAGQFPTDLPVTSGPFDVIATFHVIEHVHDPAAMLSAIRQRLKPGGILVLEYPDVERAAARPQLSPSYFQKSHLHDFSLHTMTALLRRTGFRIEAKFFETEHPYDKNTLLVAAIAEPEAISPRLPAREVDRFYRTLTQKLARSTGRHDPWHRLIRLGRRVPWGVGQSVET